MNTAVVSDSPIKEISRSLDNPTEQEAIAWRGLFWCEKRALGRMAHDHDLSDSEWFDMTTGQRMSLRIAIDQVKVLAKVFGGIDA